MVLTTGEIFLTWKSGLDPVRASEVNMNAVANVNALVDGNALLTQSSGEIIQTDSVLLADDDAVSRALLESRLRKWDFKVTTALDGLHAWHELQKKNAPSLVVLDWMMPGISGVEICRRLRARRTTPYPYILLLTSRDSKQDIVEGLDAGADDYLTKPFNVNEMKARLQVGRRILQLQNDLLRKEEELRFEASHDRLTGQWNRGAILDFLGREVERGKRSGEPVGTLLIDIDHFKSVNDLYGHQAGDAVLREVAQRLAFGLRSYDWLGRYGGEEFLVLLSNCNTEVATMCAERLRQAVASEPIQIGDVKLTVTISIGTTVSSQEHDLTDDQLVTIADAALYRAKNRGRNRVETGDYADLFAATHAASLHAPVNHIPPVQEAGRIVLT
jgi:two-component system, cell cycle response regulator